MSARNPANAAHLAILDELIHLNVKVARAVHADAMRGGRPTPEHAAALDRLSREVCRTMLLARELAAQSAPTAQPAPDRHEPTSPAPDKRHPAPLPFSRKLH